MATRMQTRSVLFGGAAMAVASLAAVAVACMDYRPIPTGLVREAVSGDPARARQSVEALRAMGPEGLGALMSAYAREIRRQTGRPVAYPMVGPDAGVAAFAEPETLQSLRPLQ